MTWLKPSVSRFVSKFVCEIIPAGVASMIGAALFALVWPGPIPVATETTASDTIVAQNEQIAQLIRDEHEAMLAFLKLEEKREIARQLPTIKEVRTSAEAEHTARHSTSVRVAEATKSVPRAKPAELPAVVEVQGVREPAPAPAPVVAAAEPHRGPLGAIVETTGEWADKAIEASQLRRAAPAVRLFESILGLGRANVYRVAGREGATAAR